MPDEKTATIDLATIEAMIDEKATIDAAEALRGISGTVDLLRNDRAAMQPEDIDAYLDHIKNLVEVIGDELAWIRENLDG